MPPPVKKVSLAGPTATNDEEMLRTCVVDLLNYFDSMVAAVGHTFGLPRLTLASVVSTYGIRVEDVFFKLSTDASAVRNLTGATITDAVNLFVATENSKVSQKYLAWLQRLRECIVQQKLTGTFSFDAIVTALAGAVKCLSATSGQTKELAKFEKELKASKVAKKFAKVSPLDKLSDVASELVKRLGAASAVDFFSNEFNSFVAQKSAVSPASSKQKLDVAMSLSTKVFKTYFADVKKSLAFYAMRLNRAKQDVPKILAMHVARNAVEAAPMLDGGNSFVLVIDNMRLHKGHAVSLDAAQLLSRVCVTIICILQRLCGNVNQSRDFALSVIDVLIEVFAAESSSSSSSSKAKAGALLTKLSTAPNKAFAYNAKHSSALTRMGLLAQQLGGNEQHVVSFPQQQQQPSSNSSGNQQQQQPSSNSSGNQQQQQQPQIQHVQVHDDPYMKTCFGCFVGLEACQTAMMCCEFCGE